MRAHPFFDTVEVRVCDMPTRIDDTVAIAALIQALMGKLYLLYRRNLAFREYSRALIEENKWRAVRYGLDGQLIDFGKQEQVPVRALIGELLEFVAEAADIFKSHDDLERIRAILREGLERRPAARRLRQEQQPQRRRRRPHRAERAGGVYPLTRPLSPQRGQGCRGCERAADPVPRGPMSTFTAARGIACPPSQQAP